MDFKEHEDEFKELVEQLVKAGNSVEEAQDIAEDQIDGYIMDGKYTEFDPDEADEVVAIVTESLDNLELEDDIVDVNTIQDMIEKALIMSGHNKTAREYMARREQRDRVREMDSRLMKCFEGLTFKNSIANDTKRENANIDGDSAMGTMLKYGSESAKEFNLLYLISPDIADAHRNGDIHIHDLDFMALTETCISDDTLVDLRIDGSEVKTVRADWFDRVLDSVDVDRVVYMNNIEIMSNGKFVKLVNCVRHKADDKRVLNIQTKTGSLKVTDNHRVSVIDPSGTVNDIPARSLKIGDRLVVPENNSDDNSLIVSIDGVDYNGYVYDFETESHHFTANGFEVHNCLQIPLDKLFKGGFNTGHGFLREPGEIRSAAALACIAIQSNQNDQHGGQSIPMFDYYLAEYVSKSYIKNIISVLEDRYDDISTDEIKEQIKAYAETRRPLDIKHRALVMNPESDEKIKEIIKEYSNILLDDADIEHVIKRAYTRTTTDTHQAMEAVIHNLNSMHSRAGAQVPFSQLNFGTDTSYEGRLVIQQLLIATDEGLGNGETPIFPKHTWGL